MILILSQNKFEYSTDKIIEWLDNLGGSYLRINGEDLLEPGSFKMDLKNGVFEIAKKPLNFNEVNVVLNRRWFNEDEYFENFFEENMHSKIIWNLLNSIKGELNALSEFFFFNLPSKCLWIPEKKRVNKLVALKTAELIGIDIPETEVLSNKTDLTSFLDRNGRIITKAISDTFPIELEKETFFYYTKEICNENLEKIPNTFNPSLFQTLIEKKYEVRVFFLFGDMYAMAIFSQNDSSTATDFRNYNNDKPNRVVPYDIPDYLQVKLKNLMNALNLNTGSIDLIKTIHNNYVFLEVNPVGQFGMVSQPCNYNLHKLFAEKLIYYDREYKFLE